MPLYTYVVSYNGRTAVHQERASNFKGSVGRVVCSLFPRFQLKESDLLSVLMRSQPLPVANAKRVWQLSQSGAEGDFGLHIIETRE